MLRLSPDELKSLERRCRVAQIPKVGKDVAVPVSVDALLSLIREATAARDLAAAVGRWLDAAGRASGAKPSSYEQGERLMFDCIDAGEACRAELNAYSGGPA